MTRAADTPIEQAATASPDAAPTRPAGPPADRATAGPTPPKRATTPPAPDRSDNGWIVPLCILIVGMSMSVLDTSIAIPTMQTTLNASVDTIEWVVTGYTLCWASWCR